MSPTASVPAKRLSIMQVAHRLKVVYRRARDLILTGKLGESSYENGHLTVSEAGVEAYDAARKSKKQRRSA